MLEVSGKEIASGKLFIRQVFAEDQWYRIPDYQRPYVWTNDEVHDLLQDVAEALENSPESQYFLGSIVLHCKTAHKDGATYQESDLLDGQQRLTTLYILHAVIRDLTTDQTRRASCAKTIYQQASPDYGLPERLRIVFDIRKEVRDFVNTYIKPEGGTNQINELKDLTSDSLDVSVRNMATAVLKIREWLSEKDHAYIGNYFRFLNMKVLLIYVASAELDDAFRLFTVLNDRGVKLRNSDILKAENLRAISDPTSRNEWATFWEELEGELGEGFDQFLSYIRTLLVKDKARLSLLKEFEDNIYNPRRFNRETEKYDNVPPLLHKGVETFQYIKRYKQHYDQLFSGDNFHLNKDYRFDNLIVIMQDTALSDIWIPPLLGYYDAFGEYRLLDFLIKLDNLFSGEWIAGEMPTTRIESMNDILKEIHVLSREHASNKKEAANELLDGTSFNFNMIEAFRQLSEGTIYGRRYARYILYKLDYIYGSSCEKKGSQKTISVEHILPQNPSPDSQWAMDFTEEERDQWTDRLGNLVLLSRRKNTAQGRLDYADKKAKYFSKRIETFPNSLRVLNNFSTWSLADLQKNHNQVIIDLQKHYKL